MQFLSEELDISGEKRIVRLNNREISFFLLPLDLDNIDV
jgi:hypothetical protein